MTQEKIIDTMMDAYGGNVTRIGMERAYKALFGAIIEDTLRGKATTVRGFGTFSLKECKERNGRNPQNGKRIYIPARKKIAFKNSTSLKEIL